MANGTTCSIASTSKGPITWSSTVFRFATRNEADAAAAVALVQTCDEYQKLVASSPSRPTYLGDLEAVSWTPPCETDHPRWTLDVWYLLAFDGRIGSGRSFLADLETKQIVSVRDFSVRTG
jgi:hypothetical protein